MADDAPKKGNPGEDALWFLAILAILVVLWYFAGGPGKADLRGVFLTPLEPLGSGDAYGPGGQATTTQDAGVQAPAPIQPTN